MISLVDNFFQDEPIHAARFLSTLSEKSFLEIYINHHQAMMNLIPYIPVSYLAKIICIASDDVIKHFLTKLNKNQVAILLKYLDFNNSQKILNLLLPNEAKVIKAINEYKPGEIGYYATYTDNIINKSCVIKDILNIITNTKNEYNYFVLVDNKYSFNGVVNISSILKSKNIENLSLDNLVTPQIRATSANVPVEEFIYTENYINNSIFPIVGKSNLLIGIIEKPFVKEKESSIDYENTNNPLNEYINFSEMLWKILSDIWGKIK